MTGYAGLVFRDPLPLYSLRYTYMSLYIYFLSMSYNPIGDCIGVCYTGY